VEAGNKLREGRLAKGWSTEKAGRVYGEAVKGKPITGRSYVRMEEGYLPQNPKRRLILAGMFSIAPALLLPEIVKEISEDSVPAKKGKTIDLKEYHTNLITSWKQGYQGRTDEILRETLRRISTLHNKVLYSGPQQTVMMQLLCGYQIWYADLAREQGYYKQALDHYNMAITLAHQEGYTDFEAAAISKRGNLFLDEYKLQPAFRDFQEAATFNVPDQLKGRILSLQALTQMKLAQTENDKKAALHLIDTTENLASPVPQDTLYLSEFSMGRYLRFRANTLMEAPIKKLRSPEQATEILDELEVQNRSSKYGEKRHSAYHQMECNLAYARVYRDQEHYPIVVTLLQDTLELTQEVNSQVHLRSISNLLDDLKITDYGKKDEVAELGIALMKAQYPHLFQ
jgi:tetratricopeptide (TPR) repeat protein